MKHFWMTDLLCILTLSIGARAGAQSNAAQGQQRSLGDIARELRGKQQTQNPCPPSNPCDGSKSQNSTALGESEIGELQYKASIYTLLVRRAFADLDGAAASARTSKERLGGGVWKLYDFYLAAATPASGSYATDADWKTRISVLQDWVKARPESITARVALAEAYRDYGWAARGGSYAGQVGEDAWKLYESRVEQAYATLKGAEGLNEKCPDWYFVMLEIARDQGWDKARTRELFNRAVACEPSYYHYYREYAYYLDPKWYGEPGEAEALAEEALKRLAGKDGAFVYFEIATVIYCMCPDTPRPPKLSWRKIQEGFDVVESSYGATMLKLNRFAMLACLYDDKQIAQRIFVRVGNNCPLDVWGDRSVFDQARAWAGSPSP